MTSPSKPMRLIVLCLLAHTTLSAEPPFAPKVILNKECIANNGSTHLLIQPSFPSSGRGWTMSLMYHALKAAGGTGVKSNLAKGFGNKVMAIGNSARKTDVDWVFTHSFDDVTLDTAINATAHPERPMLLMRVIRDPLANVEAYYRYLKREAIKHGGKPMAPFGQFADQHIQVRIAGQRWPSGLPCFDHALSHAPRVDSPIDPSTLRVPSLSSSLQILILPAMRICLSFVCETRTTSDFTNSGRRSANLQRVVVAAREPAASLQPTRTYKMQIF